MTIHKEGYPSILLCLALDAVLIGIAQLFFSDNIYITTALYTLAAVLLIIILQFFRSPSIAPTLGDNLIICPADGKVVVIEETVETEYFKDKRIQVSIFMSPINVHINRNPISGIVKFAKYHPGLFLVAWHPKSSTENERTTLVVEHPKKGEILFRQIAGALARRIVFYIKEGQKVEQGQEFGFIKFGSRVDVFLPIGTKINVELGQNVKGGITTLAEFN